MAATYLQSLLNGAGVVRGEDGWLSMPDARSLTLQIAHSGVALTISRIRALREREEVVEARTVQGEMYLLFAGDIFAVVVEGPQESSRKAGFV